MTSAASRARAPHPIFEMTHLASAGTIFPLCGARGTTWSERDPLRVDCPDCLQTAFNILDAGGDVEIDIEA